MSRSMLRRFAALTLLVALVAPVTGASPGACTAAGSQLASLWERLVDYITGASGEPGGLNAPEKPECEASTPSAPAPTPPGDEGPATDPNG